MVKARPMRRVRNVRELIENFEAIKSGMSGDTNFGAAAVLYLAECALPNLVEEFKRMRTELRELRRDLQAQRRTEELLAKKVERLTDAAERSAGGGD